jgi:hypothetical protein
MKGEEVKCSARACARYGVLVDGEEMKGSRTLLRKVLPEREEEAAVPQVIERLISRGPPAGSGIPFEAWRSWHHYGFIACPASKLRRTCSDHCCRMDDRHLPFQSSRSRQSYRVVGH